MLTPNPLCPKCDGRSYVKDRKRTNPLFRCRPCKICFTPNSIAPSNPPCLHCNGRTQKRGKRCGNQQYSCAACKKYFTFKATTERQHRARLLADGLPQMIESVVSKSIPPDLREDIVQELALAALCGELGLSELSQVVPRFRRKVYRQLLTGFRYVSLDAPIPHAEGLTYADIMAG